jgi:hypothetical protein
MQATPGSTIAPILTDAPQNIEQALSVQVERLPEETLVAGPVTGTAVEFPQGDGTSNYQAAPMLLPADLTPGEYSIAWAHAALGVRPVRIPLEVVGRAPDAVTFDAVLAAVATYLAPRLRSSTGFQNQDGALLPSFTDKTRPSLAKATEAVSRQVGDITAQYEVGEEHAPMLVTVAALRAAIDLESSHYPEQVSADRSAVRVWMDLLERYESRLEAILGGGDGEAPGEPGGEALAPVWNFPPLTPAPHVAGAEMRYGERPRLDW